MHFLHKPLSREKYKENRAQRRTPAMVTETRTHFPPTYSTPECNLFNLFFKFSIIYRNIAILIPQRGCN